MSINVYNSALCKIEIHPAAATGCYYVEVDDDPEHPMNSACISLDEAFEEAERIYLEIEEDSGQFGVGA